MNESNCHLGRTSGGARSGLAILIGDVDVVAVVAVAGWIAAHGHDVVVAAGDVLVQQTDDVAVQPLLGHVARQSVHVVGDVAVGVVVQHRTHSFERAFTGRQKQRRLILNQINQINQINPN